LVPGQSKYWYLDLQPEEVNNARVRYRRRSLLNWGPDLCFKQKDLYTVNWRGSKNTDIERYFFGKVDTFGQRAVQFFTDFAYEKITDDLYHNLLTYLSVQKLRTPKGLEYLQRMAATDRQSTILYLLQKIQNLYCSIWTEAIWQIADASNSKTKFIVSDHPVTVYNRGCYPQSIFCKDGNDPDIRLVASHTYFPLSLDKLLVFTNLSWLRDPYQKETNVRPNPDLFRPAIAHFLDIQTERKLDEVEVLEVNYITKKRCRRYIAAAEREWLFPEDKLSCKHWRKLGNGYLFMPEPRHTFMGGEVYIGYEDGTSEAFGAYGHRPWQRGFKDRNREQRESATLDRFKAEWAAMIGPEFRGWTPRFGSNELRIADSPESHERYLEEDKRYRGLPGERRRRRSLLRSTN